MQRLNSLFQQLVFWVIALGNYVVPKQRRIVLHTFPAVEDQGVAVLRWLRDNADRRLPLSFLITGSVEATREKLKLLIGDYADEVTVLQKQSVRAIWAYWRAGIVLFTHGLYGFLPVPKGQCVINMWHGMPLKRVWSGMPGCPPPQCRWLLSTSQKYSEVQALAAGFSVNKIPVTGLPRNDLLFSDTDKVRAFATKLRLGVDRVVLFLPTYRKSVVGYFTVDGSETDSALGMSNEEVRDLQVLLAGTRTRLLVKPHPMSVHYGKVSQPSEHLWIISDDWLHKQGVMLYEALGQTDALITDISSVAVDYLCLRRPVLFYFPDMKEYGKTRRFQLEPIEEWLPGPLCTSTKELMEELRQLVSREGGFPSEKEQTASLLNEQVIRGSTDRLFELASID